LKTVKTMKIVKAITEELFLNSSSSS